MEPTMPSTTRRWAGALALPAFFLALIGASLADPLDDAADGGAQVGQAADHLGALQLTYALELLAAVLFLGATMAVVGAVRGRGSGVANAAAVLGLLGGIGLALIGTGHVYLYAMAASGTTDGSGIVAARDAGTGPLMLLFFAAPLGVVLLCAAAVRSGLVRWPLLVVAGTFVVLEFVPTPFGEIPALIAGLVAFTWLAVGLLTAGRQRTPEPSPMPGTRTTSGTPA